MKKKQHLSEKKKISCSTVQGGPKSKPLPNDKKSY